MCTCCLETFISLEKQNQTWRQSVAFATVDGKYEMSTQQLLIVFVSQILF